MKKELWEHGFYAAATAWAAGMTTYNIFVTKQVWLIVLWSAITLMFIAVTVMHGAVIFYKGKTAAYRRMADERLQRLSS